MNYLTILLETEQDYRAVEELTRRAHEGDALLVLGLSGGFTHEHEIRLTVAHAEDQISAGLSQGTGLTGLASG